MTSCIFFGTPRSAVPTLEALSRISEVRAVVTRPDRPKGRSGRATPPPVKEIAVSLGLEVVQPKRMRDVLNLASGCDIGIVVAFGRMLPPELLSAPTAGMFNVHFSLLPRWRGATPVEHAILAGDSRSGVSLMQMDEGLDTGPVLMSYSTLIGGDNAGELTVRLANLGADAVSAAWPALEVGGLAPEPQDEARVTLAPRLTADDARIDAQTDAERVLRGVLAFAPKPGAWGEIDGARFKIVAARPLDGRLAPGRIDVVGGTVAMGTATQAVELVAVQPAGRAVMSGAAWFNGRRREPAELT